MPRRQDDESDDDEDFRRAMADVAPLAPDPKGRVAAKPPVAARPPAAAPGAADTADESGDYVAPGIDRRELRKLRRGDYPVEDRLDLHGHTVRAACEAVQRFVQTSRYTRRRCVCIVHGKGQNSASRTSALRGPVRELLRASGDVLAYTTAPASDGGSGAAYVLLKRK